MARAQLVEFPSHMERLVRLVEETDPAEMIEAALAALRGGTAPRDLLAAAGLAVSRSTELPAEHHGGPVHPVAGIHAVARLAERLEGDDRYLPVIQSLALANKHIHSPDMGPAAMAEVEPAPAGGSGTAALIDGFVAALRSHEARSAERHLAALAASASPGEILAAMLSVALPRNALDDHYFLYPVYAARALDEIGWQWAAVLLRPPARFLAGHPPCEAGGGFRPEQIEEGLGLYRDFGALEALIETHALTEGRRAAAAETDESAAIGTLAERIGAVAEIRSVGGLLAEALAAGLSLAGAGEALSIGGAALFLRSCSGNPFDVHILTGINARRYLLGLADLPWRSKLLALLTWGHGAEVRYLDATLRWPVDLDGTGLAGLPARSQQSLLAAIEEAVLAQPGLDLDRLPVAIDELEAPDQVRHVITLARHYAALDHDPEPFFRLMAQLVCRDEASEMHAYKLQQAAYEEYHTTRPPYRWLHLAAAARHVAIVANLEPRSVHPRAEALLAG